MDDQFSVALIVAGTAVITLFALFLIAVLVVQKNKQSRYLAEKELQNYKHSNHILQVRLEAQEDVMSQLSKEIHDNINQLLGLTQAHLYMVIDRTTDTEDNRVLKSVNELVSRAIGDLQNLSHSLSGTFINKIGLMEALQNEVDYINVGGKLKCTLEVEGAAVRLDAESVVLVFRIAQEAIHNALKHSRATKLSLLLENDGMSTRLSITDNGVGFVANDNTKSGIGFINMNQRAQSLKGSLDVQSAPGKGTQILLTIENTYDA